MNRFNKSLTVVLGVLVLALGLQFVDVRVNLRNAQAEPSMDTDEQSLEFKKWEYTCLELDRHMVLNDGRKKPLQGEGLAEMNALGAEGWEMITVAQTFWDVEYNAICFKRPLH